MSPGIPTFQFLLNYLPGVVHFVDVSFIKWNQRWKHYNIMHCIACRLTSNGEFAEFTSVWRQIVRGWFCGHPHHHSPVILLKTPYMSLPYWCSSVLRSLSVCSRQIHLSSKNSRCFSSAIPVCKIEISISFSWWFLWKCSANSEFSGRFLMSYLCLSNRLRSGTPVWPTYIELCFLQRAA